MINMELEVGDTVMTTDGQMTEGEMGIVVEIGLNDLDFNFKIVQPSNGLIRWMSVSNANLHQWTVLR
jgi:hypothetical protein